jgi:hypothetical protein
MGANHRQTLGTPMKCHSCDPYRPKRKEPSKFDLHQRVTCTETQICKTNHRTTSTIHSCPLPLYIVLSKNGRACTLDTSLCKSTIRRIENILFFASLAKTTAANALVGNHRNFIFVYLRGTELMTHEETISAIGNSIASFCTGCSYVKLEQCSHDRHSSYRKLQNSPISPASWPLQEHRAGQSRSQ